MAAHGTVESAEVRSRVDPTGETAHYGNSFRDNIACELAREHEPSSCGAPRSNDCDTSGFERACPTVAKNDRRSIGYLPEVFRVSRIEKCQHSHMPPLDRFDLAIEPLPVDPPHRHPRLNRKLPAPRVALELPKNPLHIAWHSETHLRRHTFRQPQRDQRFIVPHHIHHPRFSVMTLSVHRAATSTVRRAPCSPPMRSRLFSNANS